MQDRVFKMKRIIKGSVIIGIYIIFQFGFTVNMCKAGEEQAHEDKYTEEYPTVLNSNVYKTVTKEMLQYYSDNNISFQIESEVYKIYVEGNDIVNYDNELSTLINLEYISGDIQFEIDKKLCGKIQLNLSEIVKNHKYLYLYNNDKNVYERIYVDDIKCFTIDSEGKYLITNTELPSEKINKWFIVGGVVVLLGVMVGYVLVKKKHWFW